jgi:choline dehydrogenase-like flavoprotein
MPRRGDAPRDALILGSGAGGGPLALALSQAGLDVLVLEKGPRIRREDYPADEIEQARRRLFVPRLVDEPHTVVTPRTTTPIPTELGWIAVCLGGGTVHMGSYLYRFHPEDFRLRSRFGPYEEIADWPFGYDDLEPYYVKAEREVGVAGLGGATPFEGPRSAPYPLPPLESHPLARHLEEACRRRGLHPFSTPRAINSRPYQDRPVCAYCDNCGGFGCRTGAKGSVQEALIPRAEQTGRCEVQTGCMAKEIVVDRHGRATGCIHLDTSGGEHEARARIVFVCCSAIESARLLLLSRSTRFPDGLANGSGLVGRHLQFHGVTMGQASFRIDRHPGLPLRPWHPFLGVSVMDHYFLPAGVSDFPKGGILRFDMSPASPLAAYDRIAGSGPPLWGMELKRRLREEIQDRRAVFFEIFHDFLPNDRTFVELDSQVSDRWGLPVARIHLDVPPHHRAAGGWIFQRACEVLDDLGADGVQALSMGGTSSYLVHGTCRAGLDPRTSVLDPWCRAHEVPNLYVVDGSFMPTSGGAAPTLTILANSFRVADHVIARWRASEFGQ